MGYNTQFKVTALGDETEKAIKSLAERSRYDGYFETDYWTPGDEVKWYDWEEDLKVISKQFENTVIVIEGEGESGDVWKAWAYRGKVEVARAIIEFPTPDWVKNAVDMTTTYAAKQLDATERAEYARLHEKYGGA